LKDEKLVHLEIKLQLNCYRKRKFTSHIKKVF
jgi:hypothetical protein